MGTDNWPCRLEEPCRQPGQGARREARRRVAPLLTLAGSAAVAVGPGQEIPPKPRQRHRQALSPVALEPPFAGAASPGARRAVRRRLQKPHFSVPPVTGRREPAGYFASLLPAWPGCKPCEVRILHKTGVAIECFTLGMDRWHCASEAAPSQVDCGRWKPNSGRPGGAVKLLANGLAWPSCGVAPGVPPILRPRRAQDR